MASETDAREAVRALFQLHRQELYQYARFMLGPVDADDVVQDVFLKALRGWHRLRDATRARAWLWSILRHQVAEHMRRSYRDHLQNAAPLDVAAHVATPPVASISELESSLQRLTASQRAVVILRIIQERSTQETARLLGWTPVRVRVTLHRTLKRLAAELEPSAWGEPVDTRR